MNHFHLSDYCLSDLPLAVWHDRRPAAEEALHNHDCFEIMFISGGCGCCSVNRRRYPMIRGDFYFMAPGDRHAFSAEGNFSYYNLMFSPEIFTPDELRRFREFPRFQHWFAGGGGEPRKCNFSPFDSEKLTGCLECAASELAERAPGFAVAARAAFLEFLVFVLRNSGLEHGGVAPREPSSVGKMIDYICRHSPGRIRLCDIARAACVSPTYAGELFRRETGMTLSDYMERVRLDRARLALENSDVPVGDLALELGFCDSSYFSRRFRACTGLTPLRYRELSREHENP